MKILLTGSSGYLGSLFKIYLKDQHQFITFTRQDIDLYHPELIKDFFEPLDFDVCLHLAANAQTKACEDSPELTSKINLESTVELAKVAKNKNARFIFFSSEQVFNAQSNAPFTEETPPLSISVYGQQKIAGEKYIIENLQNYLIVRLSWMFGLSSYNIKASPNIIKNVINALLYQKPTKFTVNEHRGMTYARQLVENFENLLQCPSGILHFSSNNSFNTYESACFIASELGLTLNQIEKYILPDLDKYADNPRDYRLSNKKALQLGFTLGDFSSDVRSCLQDFAYKNN